jgi:hypothetical protein
MKLMKAVGWMVVIAASVSAIYFKMSDNALIIKEADQVKYELTYTEKLIESIFVGVFVGVLLVSFGYLIYYFKRWHRRQ